MTRTSDPQPCMKEPRVEAFDIEPRNGFLPPCYAVGALAAGGDDVAWSRVPPLPVLTDLYGEEVPLPGVTIKLAHDARFLHLHADVPETKLVARDDLSPDSPEFWRQDHIELRVAAGRADPKRAVQFILASSGSVWDSAGAWRRPGLIEARSQRTASGWRAWLRVDRNVLGHAGEPLADELFGLVAHLRWADGFADIAVSTPAELGFAQHDRWGRFSLVADRAAVPRFSLQGVVPPSQSLQAGRQRVVLRISSELATSVTATLTLTQESRSGEAQTHDRIVTLHPGVNELESELTLHRPLLHRFRLTMQHDGHVDELGAFTLRAAPPRVTTLTRSSAGPRLLLTDEALQGIARKLRIPLLRGIDLPTIDETLADAPPPSRSAESSQQHTTSVHLYLVGQVGHCLTRWVHDSDPKWIALATRFVRAALKHTVVGQSIDLQEAGVVLGFATALDTFSPQLSREDRADWVRLGSAFLDQYLRTLRARSWQVTAIPNANAVCNGAGGMMALALWDDHPDAPEAMYLCRKFIRTFLDYTQGKEGGNTEGAQYWAYGLESLLPLGLAMRNVLGTCDGILTGPALGHAANMIAVSLCNDGAMHGLNDTIPMAMGRDIAWLSASIHGDRLCLWYGDHAVRWARSDAHDRFRPARPYSIARPWSLLFRPDEPECTNQPALPVVLALRDIEYGMIRSSDRYDARWTLGIKGSRPPYTHHNQTDTGAIFVDLRGRRMILDPGYYKPHATDHSLLLISGKGPRTPVEWDGALIDSGHENGVKWITCDATRAYSGAAAQVRRTLACLRDSAVIVIDDVQPHATSSCDLQLLWQCGGPVVPGSSSSSSSTSFVIDDPLARMRVETSTHSGPIVTTIQPERSLHDTHWGYHFADCRLFPVAMRCSLAAEQPLITVITDATEHADAVPISIFRADGLLRLRIADEPELTLIRAAAGWRPG
jgi:hypothetical protein